MANKAALAKRTPSKSLATLRRVASGAARGVRRSAGLIRSGASGASRALARPAAAVKKVTKYAYSATREPLASAAAREGVSLAGHGAAYTLDSVFSWRAFGGWMRPSFFLGVGAFVLSALMGGKWRVMARNAGQGVLHHYWARGLDKIHGYLAPGSPSGTAGTDDGSSQY